MALEPLICPQCNGDVVLDDEQEFGFCKYCGTKVQNIKKDRVKLTGKVKIDISDNIEKMLKLARRAKESNDYENAEKYYSQILLDNPNNWEAQFYSIYFRSMQTKIAGMGNACIKIGNVLKVVFNLVKESNITDEEKNLIYFEIFEKVINYSILVSNNIISHAKGYANASNAINFVNKHCIGIVIMCIKLGDELTLVNRKEEALTTYKSCETYFSSIDLNTKNIIINKIKSLDPNYQIPVKTQTSGCYVATAVYGSYDCPEVWTLRRFRDNYLDEKNLGRLFIKIYYAISPKLVKIFGNNTKFIKFNKTILDKLVNKLNNKGYANTRYNDKY